jgi:iron complex transport system ATP-binding protein
LAAAPQTKNHGVMEKAILKTENISIGYAGKNGNSVLATDINLSLEKGKLVSLIGANGIGKSTLLRTLAGIQKPLSGNVFLNNKDIHSYLPLEMAQQLSLVLTEKLPPSNLTVFELIALGRQPYTNWLGKLTEDDFSKINSAMTLTETGYLSDKKHYEISDGQLQKVLVARALAQDTPLIVLDEPTTHLDLEHKFLLFRLLKKLANDNGKCILFSTHDIDMAIQLSDEMILMYDGKTVQANPETFIENHTFGQLFPNGNVTFDKEKVKFVFNNL